MEVSGRTSSLLQYFYMMPKTINIGQWWDTMVRYRSTTNNKLTFFQKVLVFSDVWGLQSEKYIKLQIVWIAQSGVNWCEERLPRVYNNVDSVTHNRTFELRTLTQVEFLSFLAKCNRVRSSGSRFLGPWSSAPGSSVFSLPLHSRIGYGWDLALITSYIKCIIICCIVLL